MKINWGILGAATIAVEQVIPAMVQSAYCQVLGIASRNLKKAQSVARNFDIPRSYGTYEALLNDAQIQAVYIPLPNHLHVAWAIKALQAGKHVLVEKPVALNAKEARKLYEEAKKHPNLLLMEAFMYKFHPQWIKVKELIQKGEIGALKIIESSFSFFESDPISIVNQKAFGGGSLMDIGCYPISISRFLFESEPKRVFATQENHPEFQVDISTSGILEFEAGTSVFFSSIQLYENQKVRLFGTEGIIELELPFNPPIDSPSKIWVTKQNNRTEIKLDPSNQYTLQADFFSNAILKNAQLPMLFEDAVKNMVVIEAIKMSADLGEAIRL
ncbi:MAG: Gfo/Idh/MocA family oxidoreductase [Flavobacteriaceae bacterium]